MEQEGAAGLDVIALYEVGKECGAIKAKKKKRKRKEKTKFIFRTFREASVRRSIWNVYFSIVGRTRAQQKGGFWTILLDGLHAVQCWYIRITKDVCHYYYTYTYIRVRDTCTHIAHSNNMMRAGAGVCHVCRERSICKTGMRARQYTYTHTHIYTPSFDVTMCMYVCICIITQ